MDSLLGCDLQLKDSHPQESVVQRRKNDFNFEEFLVFSDIVFRV